MNIVVTGLRGFPNIQGGIETHCEELYPRLAKLNCSITVVRRKCFIHEYPNCTLYKGVKFKDINTPKFTGVEAALHTIKSVIYAYKVKADIIHIHAIGPSIAIPLAKLLGLKIVVTHHGPDYNRQKWNFPAKAVLKLGEFFAAKMANEIIVISTVIQDLLSDKYQRSKHVNLIYNGVNIPNIQTSSNYIEQLRLKPGKYILAVGRFVMEKRFDMLINAYIKLNATGYKLVIVGDADYESSYSYSLKQLAKENHIVLTGILKGNRLEELYSHAALFVLPSTHEGLPITLLEAMSFQRKVLTSNIPANKALQLPNECYFIVDDTDDLIKKMHITLNNGYTSREYDLSLYNWDYIAEQVYKVYEKMIKK